MNSLNGGLLIKETMIWRFILDLSVIFFMGLRERENLCFTLPTNLEDLKTRITDAVNAMSLDMISNV